MQRGCLSGLLYIILILAGIMMSVCRVSDSHTENQEMEVVFSLNEDIDIDNLAEKISSCECTMSEPCKVYSDIYYKAEISFSFAYNKDMMLKKLEESGYFDMIEENELYYSGALADSESDSYLKDQWYISSTRADEAWQLTGDKPGKDVVVAVIDTGVNYNHRDIRANMWINEKEYNGRPGYDDDNNGIKDDIYGANFTGENTSSNKLLSFLPASKNASEGNPDDTDEKGHGTHVAGIIAMTAGNDGGCGIAYGAKIMAVKAGAYDGSFKLANVLSAINYAVNMGADVINMSFGTYSESAVIKDVLLKASKKCILVAAAGNDGLPTGDSSADNAKSVYPASYPFVIGVMAEDNNGDITSWSNYDYEPYTSSEYQISAPGYNILSASLGNTYVYMSGTSMAAPMVSGAAAMLLGMVDREENPDYVTYVRGQLMNAGNKLAKKSFEGGSVSYFHSLDIYAALTEKAGVKLKLAGIKLYDLNSESYLDSEYSVKKDTELNIACGFLLSNCWKKAKNVNVKMSVDSDICTVDNAELNIKEMEADSYIEVGVDKQESMCIRVNTSKEGSYIIPVKYEIRGEDEEDGSLYTENTTRMYVINVSADGENAVKEEQKTTSDVSNVREITPPTIPELTVKNTYIKISWDNLNNADYVKIYRASKKNGKYKLISRVQAKSKNSYKDKEVKKGVRYYYKVSACFNDGRESKMSSEASCIILKKISKINMDKTGKKLSWKKVKGAKGYNIYASNTKNGKYKKIASTKKNYYKVKKKKKYYKVKPFANT